MSNVHKQHKNWLSILRYWLLGTKYRIFLSLLSVILFIVIGSMYGISRYYSHSVSDQPYVEGVSFIPDYANYLGVDPKETLDAILNDLDVKHVRLVSYWDSIEYNEGTYDFSQLDWQFEKAEKANAKVTLAMGLRQPRWPECHEPDWANISGPRDTWYPQLSRYMTAIVERYKDSPALESYQLENEYFLKAFGLCKNFDRDRLVSEYKLVKSLDDRHPIIVSRSNNGQGIGIYDPIPDSYAISIYKRVWSPVVSRYVEYPFPSWYYGFLAGWQKLSNGQNTIIHELQAEPWPPMGKPIPEVSLEEQNKSFDAKRFESRFDYARNTGMKQTYFWGAEYWYYRKQVLNDNSVWQVAENEFKN